MLAQRRNHGRQKEKMLVAATVPAVRDGGGDAGRLRRERSIAFTGKHDRNCKNREQGALHASLRT